jgi:UPF0176 protein
VALGWHITSFYKFCPMTQLPELKAELENLLTQLEMVGLIVLAEEGINGTVSGTEASVGAFEDHIRARCGEVRFKRSVSHISGFKQVSVDIRSEIVGLKRPDLVPSEPQGHLSAHEWHAMLTDGKPKLLVDTRNEYETLAGIFRGAIDPKLDRFSDWGTYLDQADLPKDLPVMIYCTGGIRCEKAILEMRNRGFEDVYQLRDGILGYLEVFPDGEFEGECFVFDERVTVGPDLLPTGNFGVCAGCGTTTPVKTQCEHCGDGCFVCHACEERGITTCSKTCRDRLGKRKRASTTRA